MLILGRKVGESIVINEDIVIKVFKIQGNNVTIGIDAPKDVPILREELMVSELNSPK